MACLKEKSVKDEVPKMTCNVEHVLYPLIQLLWFNLECPDRFKEYKDPLKLRGIFSQVKKGKAVDRPAYVKL